MARVASWSSGRPSLSRAPAVNAALVPGATDSALPTEPLLANKGISRQGIILLGRGFVLEGEKARELIASDKSLSDVIRPYRNGRDITQTPRGLSVIDFGLMDFDEAEEYSVALDIVRARVKPSRDANKSTGIREKWWRFGACRPGLREAIDGMDRFIVTTGTAKHRIFSFLDVAIVPDAKLCAIGSDDPFHLGVLTSRIHVLWSLASGSRLGVTLVYNNSKCFDPFPFPDPPQALRHKIGTVAERLDAHRKAAQARDPDKHTLTAQYNALQTLRSGEPLSPETFEFMSSAGTETLRNIHDELDRLVFEAYGWDPAMSDEEVIQAIVALHAERIEEERAGHVRWLRPDYQVPKFGHKVGLG